MYGSAGISAVDGAVDKTRKAIETEDLDVFETDELELESADST